MLLCDGFCKEGERVSVGLDGLYYEFFIKPYSPICCKPKTGLLRICPRCSAMYTKQITAIMILKDGL